MTCSSPVFWTFKFGPNNTAGYQNHTTRDIDTEHFTGQKGAYVLQITTEGANTYANIYLSTEPGGPQALQNNQRDLRLHRRYRGKRLDIRWNPSFVDPQVTDYCLVISRIKQYNTMCMAHADLYGVPPPHINNHPVAASQTVITWHPPSADKSEFVDPTIVCVGQKTHYSIPKLKQGVSHFISLFAINGQSNFTYPYGNASIKFDAHVKPTSLKDGKSSFGNFRKFGGVVVFRFKVPKKSNGILDIYILPCGGSVDVEIILKKEVVIKRRIESFGRITVPSTKEGNRYHIKIFATNREELRKTSGVEVYATTKSTSRIPVPKMPQNPVVEEYHTLRTCNSVTVGWLPAPGEYSARYCLEIKDGKIRNMEKYRLPNQCGLENRLKKSVNVGRRYCRTIKHENEKVVTQTIDKLKAGKKYIVQVTVKKPRGKTLSYDLLQVQTKRICKE